MTSKIIDAEIPEKFPIDSNINDSNYLWQLSTPTSYVSQFKLRDQWIKKGMFAFVSWEWVNPFVEWINNRKCLEVMSGAGWLARALREKGIDIIATDDNSWIKKSEMYKWDKVSEVQEMGAISAVIKYAGRSDIFIISWPYMDDIAYKSIKKLHELNPSALIVYIGEPQYGCTANDNFFSHFQEITQDALFNKAASKFRSWEGLHDTLMLGKYLQEL